MKTFLVLCATCVLLAGCVTDGSLPTKTLNSACTALIGPIRYNSTNPASTRHAGKALAPDLKARNNVGRNLGCKGYRL